MLIFFLKREIKLFFFTFLFSILTCNFVFAKKLDLKKWDNFNYKIIDMTSSLEDNIMVLNQTQQVRLINIYTRKIKQFPGTFKKIYNDNNNIYGVSPKNNLFKLKKRIWKKLNISNKLLKNNFTIFNNYIYFIIDNKVKITDLKGRKAKNIYINKLQNIKEIKFINEETFLILKTNNQLLFYNKNQILYKQKNIKKILFVNKDYFLVLEKNGDLKSFLTDEPQKSFKKIKFKSFLNNLSVLPDGKIWASDGNKIYISSFSIEDFLSNDNKDKLIKAKKFFISDQTASSLYSGYDGLFKIDEYGYLNIWSFQDKAFISLNIKPVHFSNPSKNNFWVINSLGRVFNFNSKKWKQIPGLGLGISSKNNLTLKINERNLLDIFDVKRKKFSKTSIKAEQVMVTNNRQFWIIDKGKTKRCFRNGTKISKKNVRCQTISHSLKKIKISLDNKIYALNNKGSLEYFDGKKFKKLKIRTKPISDFLLYQDNLIWILDDKNRILHNQIRYNKSYQTSYDLLKPYFKEEDIFGTGDVILYGKKASKKDYESSASVSSGGFKFKKNMKRKTINNPETFIDLSFGRDGRLWAVSDQNDVFQYKDKSKLFKLYNKINFLSKTQKFLGLPSSVSIRRISSDHNGKIWAVKNNSKDIYYQSSFNGKFIKAKIDKKASVVTDLTIDKSGNVFVAARDIFKWNYKKRKFELYLKKNGPFIRISSGIVGTLWAINDKGIIYELIGGKIYKRPKVGKFIANDIDISTNGDVFITSEIKKTTKSITKVIIKPDPKKRGKTIKETITEINTTIDQCDLYRLNHLNGKIERVFKDKSIFAEIISVSTDGTPWVSSGECGQTNIYYGTN